MTRSNMSAPHLEDSVSTGQQVLLVVDDYADNLEAMEELLTDGDWAVRTASSGEQALRCLMEVDVGLVLLDVQMPLMDGFEVARLMRGNPRTRYTPIIFLSAMAHTEEAMTEGYAVGAVDFILKPFDPQVLRHKIQALWEQERHRRELQLLTQQLDSERAFNASILDNAAEGILVVDQAGLVKFANPAMARMLHCQIEDLCAHPVLNYIKLPGSAVEWELCEMYQCLRQGRSYRVHDAVLSTFSGSNLPIALSCSPLAQQHNSMVLIALDMSVVRNLHAQLVLQAVTDALTGLYNRRGLHQALEAALARAQRSNRYLAVLYLDLDGFKKVNDSLGHEAGDRMLRLVSEQLKSCLRPYDSVARMGGDEFTAVLEDLDKPEAAARVAEKLIELISVRHNLDGVEVTMGVSIGIAYYPECSDSVEGLLRSADIAMYEAKRAGRQQYRFYSAEMNGRARARLMFEENLRSAISEQAFELYYQPQVDLASGRLRGFEALLRWPQVDGDFASPGLFIPMLEETRLINQLGDWIFDQGIAQCRQWGAHFGQGLVLSLNISPVQFGMPQLVDTLRRLLEQHQLNPAQLEVEVTESALMQDLEVTRETLRQLRELGVKIAIDDFGTGYSSLAYLRHFELDTLKIDRLFIDNMLSSPKDAAIVSTIIDIGQHLGLEVIAEGVETEAQRLWLVQHKCSTMQGFLLAPALPVPQAQAFPRQVDWQQWRLSETRFSSVPDSAG